MRLMSKFLSYYLQRNFHSKYLEAYLVEVLKFIFLNQDLFPIWTWATQQFRWDLQVNYLVNQLKIPTSLFEPAIGLIFILIKYFRSFLFILIVPQGIIIKLKNLFSLLCWVFEGVFFCMEIQNTPLHQLLESFQMHDKEKWTSLGRWNV